jgi:hypothetical protein
MSDFRHPPSGFSPFTFKLSRLFGNGFKPHLNSFLGQPA